MKLLDLTVSTSVPFNGSGSITAYLIAWNGTKWVSGNANQASFPNSPSNPVAGGPSTDFPAPTLVAPATLPGSINVSKAASTTDLGNWKIVYRLGSVGMWEIVDFSTNTIPVQMAGSMDVYLMAWSASQNRWISGALSSVSYPTGSTSPTLIGEGMTLSVPTISVPAILPGQITISPSVPDPTYSTMYAAVKFGDTGSYRLVRTDSSLSATHNGKVTAYLIAWNNGQAKWVSGPSTTKTIGQSSTEATIVPPGGPLPSIVLHGTSSLPGTCTFSFSSTSAASAGYSNWKVVYQLPGGTSWVATDTGKSVPFDNSGNLSAYLEAWSSSSQQWVSGPMNNIYVPTPAVVDPPVFKDANGNTLDSVWEQDGSTISLQIAGTGTIYYTTNNNYPSPGMSGTSVWDPTQKLTFPLDLYTLTIQAVAKSGTTTSNVSRLAISRPLWTRQDNLAAGCVQSDAGLVLACGDATGPWRWDTTGNKWNPLDAAWQVGQAQQLLITTKFVFTATRTGSIRRMDRTASSGRFVELGVRTRPSNPGGLAVARDTLWVSTANGPFFYDAASDAWAAPKLPAGTNFNPNEGPAWSDGGVLWMAFGPDLWRYGTSNGGPAIWQQWNSTYPNISWLGPDPFNTASAAMDYGTNFGQIGTVKMMASTNYLNINNGASVVQVASNGTNAYAATDNGTGSGGVVHAGGWAAQFWSNPDRDWPSVSNRSISSQGVAVFSAHGHDWLVASTPQGTYTLKLK